jgi:transposase
MDTDTELVFLQELKKKYPSEHVVVVMDNAPCHKPVCLHKIPGLTVVYLPSYSPELNPVERFFEEIRRATACEIFDTLELVEERISKAVNEWSDNLEKMKNLICYPWIQEQIGVVS